MSGEEPSSILVVLRVRADEEQLQRCAMPTPLCILLRDILGAVLSYCW